MKDTHSPTFDRSRREDRASPCSICLLARRSVNNIIVGTERSTLMTRRPTKTSQNFQDLIILIAIRSSWPAVRDFAIASALASAWCWSWAVCSSNGTLQAGHTSKRVSSCRCLQFGQNLIMKPVLPFGYSSNTGHLWQGLSSTIEGHREP
jgi:hypothetical protein